jgi:uncharacterized membrane protein YedE/YeeE
MVVNDGYISGWWYTYLSEKYENSSVGIWWFPIYGKIIHSCSKPPTRYCILTIIF